MTTSTLVNSITGFPWETLITNLAADIGGVFVLVEAVAYLLGIVFLVSAFNMAAKAANHHHKHDVGKFAWAWSLAFASLMFALPSTIGGLSVTMFGADV